LAIVSTPIERGNWRLSHPWLKSGVST
jgi:hypothetical protein